MQSILTAEKVNVARGELFRKPPNAEYRLRKEHVHTSLP